MLVDDYVVIFRLSQFINLCNYVNRKLPLFS